MANWPPLAPVPPPEVQSAIPSQEWELYIDAWVLLLGLRIEASDAQFRNLAPNDESAVSFLTSFYALLSAPGTPGLHAGTKAKTLRKLSFLLTRRYLLELAGSPAELLEWKYLGSLSCCYPSSSAAKKLLSDVWNKHEPTISSSLEKAKSTIIKQLSIMNAAKSSGIMSDIRTLTILVSALPQSGPTLMAGADYLDTFSDAYQAHRRDDIRRVLVANIYVGLVSLLKGPQPNLSLLLDQLFSLKASAGAGNSQTKKEATLLSDVICSSDLLVRLERYLLSHPQKRGQDLVSSLRAYQADSKVFHHRYQKQKKNVDKGKGRASDLPRPEELHIHKMSLVTQVQDLFPDLGSGYIVRLLDQFDDNPETVVAHLLDDSIPSHLQTLDKSEQLPTTSSTIPHDPLPPKSTPPSATPEPIPTRKNVFDSDIDLAELARSDGGGKLHFGGPDPNLTTETVLNDRSQHATNKAAILSALATFDSDDDERDDTYDVADVGGTVDAATTNTDADADARKTAEDLDLTLFRAYKANSALFARDSATRRSQPRASLKRETGMTDEAIEGWAVMLTRDPKRLARLEDKTSFAGGGGGGPGGAIAQPELRPTAYRKPGPKGDDDESEPDEPSGSTSRGRGGSTRGRGRGGGRRGGGGNRRGGGASGDQSSNNNGNTAASRQRKEENKSSRANHNRRQQRAKKVARAGGMVG
ncbi:putative CUE domain protein [Aspergillus steynii IBT 23096]|uniref:Putative CUE domain protein n=1 Tax=Aspergillus steynii IBT 23096 TaxID=1392250 RepID=A0A2I2FYP9_9EURO|nr:putative CUE domain protein [Aspergillus steynii IBT 23096]PLB45763.1 putative CUE domain protein [Aspergillus steynii IBT 23096]